MMYKGKGFFFHPQLAISKTGDSKLGKLSAPHIRKIIIDLRLDSDIRIVVTDDGFICPITKLPDPEIHKFVNIVISTLITKGIQSLQVSWKSDWAFFRYEDGSDVAEVGKSRSEYSLRNLFEFQRDKDSTFQDWYEIERIHLTTDLLIGLLKQAYRFYVNPDYADDLLMIGQAWSLSYTEMEQASFLYAWMIIENMIENTLEEYIDSLSLSSAEKKIIKDQYRKISQRIDGLSISGEMDDTTKKTLCTLKNIRNDIVHDRRHITSNESYDCLKVATELVYNKLNHGDDYLIQKTELHKIK